MRIMKRRPTAARIATAQSVEIYDQNGIYLYRVSVSPQQVRSAQVCEDTLSINLLNGRVKVFTPSMESFGSTLKLDTGLNEFIPANRQSIFYAAGL